MMTQVCHFKICFKCKEEKSTDEFYQHPQMGDGYLGKCKSCAKEDVKKHRLKILDNIEQRYYVDPGKIKRCKVCKEEKPIDSFYFKESGKYHRRAECIGCSDQTKWARNNPEKAREMKRRWYVKNRHKKYAQTLLKRAVDSGRLIRPDVCSDCGRGGEIQGHHPDYSKPLDVEWLCTKCHGRKHRLRQQPVMA